MVEGKTSLQESGLYGLHILLICSPCCNPIFINYIILNFLSHLVISVCPTYNYVQYPFQIWWVSVSSQTLEGVELI